MKEGVNYWLQKATGGAGCEVEITWKQQNGQRVKRNNMETRQRHMLLNVA
jgi:hypothetical protein